jgi:hypothetical protein
LLGCRPEPPLQAAMDASVRGAGILAARHTDGGSPPRSTAWPRTARRHESSARNCMDR